HAPIHPRPHRHREARRRRHADGLRAAARALPCGPESMLALRARGGALEFELLADGVAPPPGFAVAMWPRVDRRVAGDGALRLAMPACAAPVPAE
ncbi:MAG: hypothetical protein AAF192_21665, partial [Pseudomonadota bacterium]